MHVINSGIPGASTRELLARLEELALRHKPGWVIILAGTNDALNSAKMAAAPAAGENLRQMAAAARRAGARVVLATLPPCLEASVARRHAGAFAGEVTPMQRLNLMNAAIREIAREEGLALADAAQAFAAQGMPGESPLCLLRNTANCGADDGVHPTAAGYALLAGVVAAALPAGLPEDAVLVCLGDSITAGVHVTGQGTAGGDTYPGRLRDLLQKRSV